MERPSLPDVDDPVANANTLFAWLEQQPESQSSELAEALFEQLLDRASRSRTASVNACTKLVGFVQHCAVRSGSSSSSSEPTLTPVRAWAFRAATAQRLFHFYMEWNEKDQHRSMRLVLDLLTLLILQNPDAAVAAALRAHILQALAAIIGHRSTRPLVKSSIASLNHLLAKSVFTLDDVARAYRREVVGASDSAASRTNDDDVDDDDDDLALWQRFVRDMFAWMTLHYVCPVAGKLLVSVFTHLRICTAAAAAATTTTTTPTIERPHSGFTAELWLQWLRDGLAVNPRILEDVKLYFFIPLFKADRESSLELLEVLNRTQPATLVETTAEAAAAADGIGSGTVLQLAVLEVGKKAGLVEDAGVHVTTASPQQKQKEKSKQKNSGRTVVLNEAVLDEVMGRAPADVRSVALSLLVSSQSTTRPFTAGVFALLRKHLPGYHAEPDAKFRYELLAHSRDMVMRLKSAIAAMRRSEGGEVSEADEADEASKAKDVLAQHEAFLSWYLGFLKAELAPTASYQRHFTALRATTALLRVRRDVSGGVGDALDEGLAQRLCGDAAWVRGVLDLLVDPFDDVRETAASLLVQAGAVGKSGRESLTAALTAFSRRAEALAARTTRADHADGAARCQGLLASWTAEEEGEEEEGKEKENKEGTGGGGLLAQEAILDGILDRLEAKLTHAEADLGAAVVSSPLHGDFAAVRYVWDVLGQQRRRRRQRHDDGPDGPDGPDDVATPRTLAASQARIVRCCERTWRVVGHVLCDSSPEGLLPEAMEDVAGLESRDLLSYSFRAVNESSNTMRAMVGHLRFSRVRGGTLRPSRDVFAAVGALSFAQLAALRHRGALSAVAQTFTLCCQLAQDPLITPPGTADDDTLLMGWYQDTLKCIANQISTTRRSAGIPALFSGVLAAGASRPSLDEAVATACAIAQQPAHVRETDGSRLPQVHALNCLRDVFRSSLLSKRAERLLPACLQLAASMLQSEVWAIRNCSLLLLRSLIDCLFGTGESKASLESGWDGRTIRVSYNKHPTLPGVLLKLLAPPTMTTTAGSSSSSPAVDLLTAQQAAAESVFPALDILRRAGPPDDAAVRDALYRAVVAHLASRLWHVREMAARTVCSFLVGRDWAAGLADLLRAAASCSAANSLHGTLLAVRFMLVRTAEVARDELPDNLPRLSALLHDLAGANTLVSSCPEVEAAYLEAVNTISGLALELGLALTTPDIVTFSSSSSGITTTSALLRAQRLLQANYATLRRNDRDALQRLLQEASHADPDSAAQLLDVASRAWWLTSPPSPGSSLSSSRTPETAAWLCRVYMDVCLYGPPSAVPPQLWAAALVHLAETMDYLFAIVPTSSTFVLPLPLLLPSADSLARLWSVMCHSPDLGPTLSCAVLRASGPIMAALIPSSCSALTAPSLSAWAAMMATAGKAGQTFDSRMAAVQGLRSFVVAVSSISSGGGRKEEEESLGQDLLLPVVFCVYDALNDDDDEIRAVAAEAAAAPVVLGTPLVPAEAARRLPGWMVAHYGHVTTFCAQAAWRSVGELGVATATAAACRLEAALRFDDALFSVEEQNLYVDEVREARRWASVVELLQLRLSASSDDSDSSDAALAALTELAAWTADGLQALVDHVCASVDDDGPLGWTASPSAFAVCAHLLIGGRALTAGTRRDDLPDQKATQASQTAQATHISRIARLLDQFCSAGQASHVHGLLLDMAQGVSNN